MTIDDEKSVYVGGLPYDCTQEDLHRAFDLYGAIVEVKLINDRQVGGKCYGFVTFRNPRSAVDAIMDMKGKKIGGRVVRVNEVHTRGGRPNFHQENFHRVKEDYWDRGRERAREREREKEREREREKEREREREREKERESERDHLRDRDQYLDRNSERSQNNIMDSEREPDFEHDCDFIQASEHPVDQVLDLEDEDHERRGDHDKDWERDHDTDWNRDRESDKPKDRDGGKSMDKEQQSRQRQGTGISDHQSRDVSSNSSDDYRSQVRKEVKEQLELSIHRREELENEITIIGDKIEDKKLLISDLQEKSQKLEDSLANAKKATSQRQSMLMKLHSCFLQSQDLADRLKSSEQELQSLVDAATSEVDAGKDADSRDG